MDERSNKARPPKSGTASEDRAPSKNKVEDQRQFRQDRAEERKVRNSAPPPKEPKPKE